MFTNPPEDLEVHGAAHVAPEGLESLAAVLVGEEDGLLVPVVPVHELLVHGHGERVHQLGDVTQDLLEVPAVDVAGGDEVLVRVHPVNPVGELGGFDYYSSSRLSRNRLMGSSIMQRDSVNKYNDLKVKIYQFRLIFLAGVNPEITYFA